MTAEQANGIAKAYGNGQLMEAPGPAWVRPLVGPHVELGEQAL